LLEPKQAEVIRITRSELDARAKQALTASERAWKLTEDDPEAVRIRVDSLRLADDLAGARSLVPKLAEHTSEGDYAYVLAAVEMCEKTPNWTTVIDRLRVATAGEQNLGRARAALIYALVRSGQVEAAKIELEALDKRPRAHALLAEIKDFVARMAELAANGGLSIVGGADADVLDPSRLPPAAIGEPRGEGAPGETVAAGSYQDLLKKAHAARRSGNLDEAERLYKSVLVKNPGDTEALAGLGDIARARGDTSASVDYYEKVSKDNPGYLPAMMGLADAKWESGDRAGAVALYQQVITATGGQGAYAARARQRIAEASKQPADAAPPEPTATATAPETPPQPTTEPSTEPTAPAPTDTGKTTPPGVDTSDLPGWTP
jgi:tetratricopeptide (TPR) repeat protein